MVKESPAHLLAEIAEPQRNAEFSSSLSALRAPAPPRDDFAKESPAHPLAETAEPQRNAEFSSPLRALRVPAPPRDGFAKESPAHLLAETRCGLKKNVACNRNIICNLPQNCVKKRLHKRFICNIIKIYTLGTGRHNNRSTFLLCRWLNNMNEIIVHQVNIAHYRLVELSKLADQAKPFYDWVEKVAKQLTGYSKSLSEILLMINKSQIKQIILSCYSNESEENPLLFDGE